MADARTWFRRVGRRRMIPKDSCAQISCAWSHPVLPWCVVRDDVLVPKNPATGRRAHVSSTKWMVPEFRDFESLAKKGSQNWHSQYNWKLGNFFFWVCQDDSRQCISWPQAFDLTERKNTGILGIKLHRGWSFTPCNRKPLNENFSWRSLEFQESRSTLRGPLFMLNNFCSYGNT